MSCIHFGAIKNNASLNIHVQAMCGRMFLFLSYNLHGGVELQSDVNYVNYFEELPDCFAKCLDYFTFLSAVYEGSNFPIRHF